MAGRDAGERLDRFLTVFARLAWSAVIVGLVVLGVILLLGP